MKLICGQCGQEHEMSEERFRNQFQQELDEISWSCNEGVFRTWLSGYTESLTDENLLIVQSELDGDGLKVFHELTEGRFSKVACLNNQAPKKPVNRENQAECLAWYLAYAWWQGKLGIDPCDDNPKEAAERANSDWQAWMGEAESALELWPALRENNL